MKMMVHQGPETNRLNKGISLKDYSPSTAKEKVNKSSLKHHWEKGNKCK